MHVVAGEVERNQALEDDGPSGKSRRQKDEQARGGAAVGDHVQDGAEPGRLVKGPGGISVEGVEQARDAVEQGARARVQRHVVQGRNGEDDSAVSWQPSKASATSRHMSSLLPSRSLCHRDEAHTYDVGPEQENVLVRVRVRSFRRIAS